MTDFQNSLKTQALEAGAILSENRDSPLDLKELAEAAQLVGLFKAACDDPDGPAMEALKSTQNLSLSAKTPFGIFFEREINLPPTISKNEELEPACNLLSNYGITNETTVPSR